MSPVRALLIAVSLGKLILLLAAISVYHLYQIKCCASGKSVEVVAQGSNRLFLWMCGLCFGIPLFVEAIMLNTESYGTSPNINPWYVCTLSPLTKLLNNIGAG